MRSTTFDMIGMILMAVATTLICGGMATWAYLRESRGSRKPARTGAETGNEHTTRSPA